MDWQERRTQGTTPEELSEAVFSGRILCFEGLAPVRDLVTAARRCAEAAFPDVDPVSAHQSFSKEEYATRHDEMRRSFLKDKEANEAVEEALAAAGVDQHVSYRDALVLRVSPPDTAGFSRGFGTVPPHRDSWGSGVLSQINWWLPVYPVTRDRTLAILPAHWTKKIENDSDGWDWRRAGKEPGVPLLPTVSAEPDRSGEIRLVVEPGTLVAFSAAHLHASVANTTDHARFSCEIRTISLDDERAGRGAPNIDGGAVNPAFSWFHRLGNGEKLSASLAGTAETPDCINELKNKPG